MEDICHEISQGFKFEIFLSKDEIYIKPYNVMFNLNKGIIDFDYVLKSKTKDQEIKLII